MLSASSWETIFTDYDTDESSPSQKNEVEFEVNLDVNYADLIGEGTHGKIYSTNDSKICYKNFENAETGIQPLKCIAKHFTFNRKSTNTCVHSIL